MSTELGVLTEQGPARWVLDAPEHPDVLLLLGHGAGGGVEAPDLAVLAHRLPAAGVAVARFEQPWRTAGRRVAVAPPRLDQAWLQALPVVLGGRSAGARVACRTAGRVGASAVLCLSFPLHLPGRDTSRLPELLTPDVPRVVLQGERDPCGGSAELRDALVAAGAQVVGPDGWVGGDVIQVRTVPGAGHDLAPARRAGVDPQQWRTLLGDAGLAAVAVTGRQGPPTPG